MEIITRYSIPTRYDPAPFGAICRVTKSSEIVYYIQICKESNKYNWIRLGDFFETIFLPQISNDNFIEYCLSIFFNHGTNFEIDKIK